MYVSDYMKSRQRLNNKSTLSYAPMWGRVFAIHVLPFAIPLTQQLLREFSWIIRVSRVFCRPAFLLRFLEEPGNFLFTLRELHRKVCDQCVLNNECSRRLLDVCQRSDQLPMAGQGIGYTLCNWIERRS